MSVILALGKGRAQVGGPGVQGYPHVRGEFETTPGFMRSYVKKKVAVLLSLTWAGIVPAK